MSIAVEDLEVLDLVAKGGMAEVYRARLGDQTLAVKKILPEYTRDQDVVRMFMDEARVAQMLIHPNIVRVHDLAVSEGGDYFIVMEFVDGKDLSDVIHAAALKHLKLTPQMCTFVARQVLSALILAHSARDRDGRPMNLIHRDISPHNVMVAYDGTVKLMDFGIAKVQHSGHQTMAGLVKGKFGYMSPEQARGKKLDARSDLYNVGILLYEMLTGTHLFTGTSDVSTISRMRSAAVPPLPASLECPDELEAAVRTALQKSADSRFPDARAFELALKDVCDHQGYTTGARELGQLARDLFGVRATRPVEVRKAGGRAVPLQSALDRKAPPADKPATTERSGAGRPPAPPVPPPAPAAPAAPDPPRSLVVAAGRKAVALSQRAAVATVPPPVLPRAPVEPSDAAAATVLFSAPNLPALSRPTAEDFITDTEPQNRPAGAVAAEEVQDTVVAAPAGLREALARDPKSASDNEVSVITQGSRPRPNFQGSRQGGGRPATLVQRTPSNPAVPSSTSRPPTSPERPRIK